MLGELTRCRADCSWTRRDELGVIDAWETTIRGDAVAARVLGGRGQRPFEVEVTIDKGSGPRRAHKNEAFPSEAKARARLATILRNGVEGKALR